MAYKGRAFDVPSVSHLLNDLRTFMISCGWEDETPAGAGDTRGMILGFFMKSTGENGAEEILANIHTHSTRYDRYHAPITYLDGGIDDSVTTFDVDDVTHASLSASDFIRIDDEIVQIGTISSNQLLSCTRGYGDSTEAAHSDDAVVQRITDAAPCVEIYAFRDLDNEIDSATASSGITQIASSSITGYKNDLFAIQMGLVKFPDNKMRWVHGYDGGTGQIDYQPLPDAQGSGTVEVYSGGFLPGWSTRSYADRWDYGTLLHDIGVPVGGVRGYFYGCKDYIYIVNVLGSGSNYPFFFGNMLSTVSAATTTITSGNDVTAGDTVIYVDDTAIFTPGQRLRVVSQDVADWTAEWDRSSDTRGGATPGDWDDLDIEEIPTELWKVAAVNPGAGTITLDAGSFYSYTAGAIVGENPRPVVRSCHFYSGAAFYYNFMTMYDNNFLGTYHGMVDYTTRLDHASHRQFFRVHHATSIPWTPLAGWTKVNCSLRRAEDSWEPMGFDPLVMSNKQFQTDNYALARCRLLSKASSGLTDEGIFSPAAYGVFPGIFQAADNPPLGANKEDTVLGFFNGSWETYRLFKTVDNDWYALGPEIA